MESQSPPKKNEDEATSINKPNDIPGSSKRSTKSPPKQCCPCDDNLNPEVEKRWIKDKNQSTGNDSLPQSALNSSQLAIEHDKNEFTEREADSSKITGSPQLKPFPGPTARKKLERYQRVQHEQDEATSVSKRKYIACSSESLRSTGVRTRRMESQTPPKQNEDEATSITKPNDIPGSSKRSTKSPPKQCCPCDDNLNPNVEKRWMEVKNQYLCSKCGAIPPARSHTPTGNDSLPQSALNSSQLANLTDEDEDIEHDKNEFTEREADSSKITGSPQLKAIPQVKKDVTHKNSNLWVYFGIPLVIVIVAIGAYYAIGAWYGSNSLKQTGSSCENFLQLRSKYPKMDDGLWSTLIVGVNLSLNQDPGEPATFIFLYNSSSVGEMLLDDVTRIAIDCFGSKGAIWRTSNDFKSTEIAEDYGNVLDRHREELKSKKILVVRDLDQVPPTAAKIFFTICDTYEPLVHKAMIFFTIDISRQPEQVVEQDRSATSIAEDILKGLWRKELQPNTLNPLVVRLTENVFRID
ncbi:uncharacterized protein LOC109406026 isoform X5 [Aedes albopictus]|uniref:Uncharacterized protein n=1 Tax=Aedes albopictus TaxID=7160 RepID=A0ABM2A367_AEDAL